MDDISHTVGARPGSGNDLARRMDRLESRQDAIETEVRTLAATVARVETNQLHATELNKLRFDALDTGLKAIGSTLAEFTKRIEGILSGEVVTAQGRQGQELLAEYRERVKVVDRRLDDLEAANERQSGIWAAIGGVKGAVLVGAAVASPVVTILAVLIAH